MLCLKTIWDSVKCVDEGFGEPGNLSLPHLQIYNDRNLR